MGKNQSASGLTNIVQYDNDGNISLVSGSTTLLYISSSGAITTRGIISGSNALSASYAASASNAISGAYAVNATTASYAVASTTASYSLTGTSASYAVNATTASYAVVSTSASYATDATTASYAVASTNAANATLFNNTASSVFSTTGSNTLTGTQYVSNTNNATAFSNTTASIYTDGGLQVTKDAYFSSSMFIKGNLTVFGTQSVSFITSSQLNISTNLITVNTDTPSIRFGGLAVYDSGSTGLTGSILWDSQNNHWIYTNPSGSSYSGGMLISGPRNTGSIGDEQGTTLNAIMKGMGGDHITSSAMFESGSNVGIGTSSPAYTLDVNGTGRFSGTSGAFIGLTINNTDATGSSRLRVTSTGNNVNDIISYSASHASRANQAWLGGDGSSTITVLQAGGNEFLRGASTGAATFSSTVTATDQIKVTGSGAYLSIYDAQASSKNWAIRAGHDVVGDLAIRQSNSTGGDPVSAGTTRLYINASGLVGIGTTNPTGSLDVSGSVYIRSTGGGVLFIPRMVDPSRGLSIGEQNSSGSKAATIRTAGGVSEHLFIDPGFNNSDVAGNIALAYANTGSVGIGTYLPYSKFHQVTWDATYSGDGRFGGSSTQFGIELKYNQASTTSGSIYCSPGYSSTGVLFKLGAGSGNTNQLVLKGDGNIGIGTINPTVSQTGGGLQLGDGTGQKGIRFDVGSGGWGYIEFYETSTAKWISGFRSADNSYNIKTGTNLSTGNGLSISSNGVATFTSTTTNLDNITVKNGSGKTNVIIGSAGGTALYGGMQMFDPSSAVAVYLITDSTSNSYMFSGLSIGANLASYKLQISTDSAGKPNGGSWANSSDIRLKENIHTIDNALDKIIQLRGVTFDWKDETEQDNIKSSGGFIADEVMLAFPNWVKEVNSSDKQKEIVNDDKIKSLSLPFEFDALLVEAIKELNTKLDAANAEIEALKSR